MNHRMWIYVSASYFCLYYLHLFSYPPIFIFITFILYLYALIFKKIGTIIGNMI